MPEAPYTRATRDRRTHKAPPSWEFFWFQPFRQLSHKNVPLTLSKRQWTIEWPSLFEMVCYLEISKEQHESHLQY